MGVTSWSRATGGKRYRKAGYKVKGSARKKVKNYPGKFSSAGLITKIRRPDFGLPDKIGTKLRYCDTLQLAGSPANNVFRMNSLFDPDLTNVGHQPMYFDQFAALYSYYRVRGSKINVTYTQYSPPALVAANVAPALCGIVTQASSALAGGTAQYLMEDPNSVWEVLQDKSGGNNVVKLSSTFSPNRDLGLDPEDDLMAAAVGANPSAVYHAHVWKVDQGATSTTTEIYVEIEFTVEFFRRIEPVQS